MCYIVVWYSNTHCSSVMVEDFTVTMFILVVQVSYPKSILIRCLGTWLCACNLLVSNALLCERHSVYFVIIRAIMVIACITLIMSEMFTLSIWIVRCTINPGENEALVRYALDTYKFLSLVLQVRFQILLSFVMTLEMIDYLRLSCWL